MASAAEEARKATAAYAKFQAAADLAETSSKRTENAAARIEARESRIDRAYERLEKRINSEERKLSFWYFMLFGFASGCGTVVLLVGLWQIGVGFGSLFR